MAILLPELADEDLTGAMDRVSGYITAENGAIKEILSDSPWGRRRLAYTIRFNGTDYRDGYYAIWHFDLEPGRMNEVERELKLDTRVIRYLLVHDDPKWGSPNDQQNQAAGEATAATGEAPAAATEGEVVASTAPAAEAAAPTADAPTAPGETEARTVGETVATTDEVVTTADDAVETTDDVAGTTGETIESTAEPEAVPPAAPVEGATGEETTAVVDEGTNAAVEAPVDETAEADNEK